MSLQSLNKIENLLLRIVSHSNDSRDEAAKALAELGKLRVYFDRSNSEKGHSFQNVVVKGANVQRESNPPSSYKLFFNEQIEKARENGFTGKPGREMVKEIRSQWKAL